MLPVIPAIFTVPAMSPRVPVKQQGALLISGVLYAELLAYPKANEAFLEEFLEQTGIVKDLRFQDSVWMEAGRRFARGSLDPARY